MLWLLQVIHIFAIFLDLFKTSLYIDIILYCLVKMPEDELRVTQKQSEQQYYGGCPCDLSKTGPSTDKQLIKFFYYFNMTEVELPFWDFILRLSNDLILIWQAVNPRLFLISIKTIRRKVKDLLNSVKHINRKHAKVRARSNLDDKLNKLFDTSDCSLLVCWKPCRAMMLKFITSSYCKQGHNLWLCLANLKVPLEKRAYLRGQQLKAGSKGNFQMA